MRKTSALCFLLLTSTMLQAQQISLSRIDLQMDKLVVYFTLDDTNPNHTYQISLYSSKDNFATPLTKVAGDVGTEVKPGADKKIQWNMSQELGQYKGELSIEVRARVFVPFVKLTAFDTNRKYKRGKTYPLLWSSGNMGGQIDIDLYEGQNRIDGDRNVPNTGKYEFAINGSVKSGKDYRLKFTNTRNRDEYIFSQPFQIVPKVPFLVKAGGVAVVAAGLYFLFSGGDSPVPPDNSKEIEEWPTGLPNN
ncbi:MAG TPA: Ser-Thr-rich GPI-anchored membrane family protein [Chryseosolibacter sp.]